MYFDTNESNVHKKAKEKLFDLIACRRVKILDQHGSRYDVFTGKDETEFLHLESFVMDYSSDALFSNPNSPCRKYLKDSCCDGNGHYGAFREIPCAKRIANKFEKYMTGSSIFASFRADIAFGYEGKHKIWLEIKNTHPCSKKKIEFCKKQGIILLEIDSRVVNNFKEYNGELVFDKLEEYVHVLNIYDATKETIKYIEDKLKEQSYVDATEVSDFTRSLLPEQVTGYQLMTHSKTIEENFVRISIEGKELKKYFGVKRKCYGWISKETFQILIEKGLVPDPKVENEKRERRIEEIFLDYWNENSANGYIITSSVINYIKKNQSGLSEYNFSELFNKLGYTRISFTAKKDKDIMIPKLRSVGIDINEKHKRIIIKKEVAIMIAKN